MHLGRISTVLALQAKCYIISHAQWASKLGAGEDPGHEIFTFPTRTKLRSFRAGKKEEGKVGRRL